ncbi:MAG: DUF5053 domain-containing protein [Prevotellaceae bacterium]|jgi:alpha-N-acetylglucosamine transferase|nr:DUF5053 domain-containing protein [Prevotellaceae bacterium]
MDTKKEFFRLKDKWKRAKGSEKELVEKEMDNFFASLTETQKVEVQSAVTEDFSLMHKEVSEINKVLDTREKLAEILPYISVSNIAKNFFGKSSSWFYQRLNGNKIHGKSVQFSPQEILTLQAALVTISQNINKSAKGLK